MKDRVVAVDLGGTHIRVALADNNGRFDRPVQQDTLADEGPEPVLNRIINAIRDIAPNLSNIRGIGLAAPGPVDPWSGVIFSAPNLPGMINLPINARLEEEFNLPVFVGNDANLGAMGEHRYGAGRGVSHMIYMTVSTGIGGGIIADNQLYLGARGLAGEVGHQTLEAHGPQCNCGNVGCLEVLASGPAIARAAQDAVRAGRASIILERSKGDIAAITARLVVDSARDGDLLARQVLERAGFYIGLGIVNLLHEFDSQLFVVGGGVAIHAWDFLYPSLLQVLDRHAMPAMRQGVRVLQAGLGSDSVIAGAVGLALDGTSG
jgi:glucokinase